MPHSKAQQRETYRRMLRIRRFEEEGTKLYTAGAIPAAIEGLEAYTSRTAVRYFV
jgi:TPP-dependent pyruvate/acetoin dehydrogenase alpha subunit